MRLRDDARLAAGRLAPGGEAARGRRTGTIGPLMFSYRHAFHAGNHADALKHVTLLATLRHLMARAPR